MPALQPHALAPALQDMTARCVTAGNSLQKVKRHCKATAQIRPGFLSLAQAGQYAGGVSLRTIRRWLRLGLRACQPVPHGCVMIKITDLDNFLAHAQTDLDQVVEDVLEELQGKGRARRRPRHETSA